MIDPASLIVVLVAFALVGAYIGSIHYILSHADKDVKKVTQK
jgi:hypothetical protein